MKVNIRESLYNHKTHETIIGETIDKHKIETSIWVECICGSPPPPTGARDAFWGCRWKQVVRQRPQGQELQLTPQGDFEVAGSLQAGLQNSKFAISSLPLVESRLTDFMKFLR